uniref:Glycerophosphocholine acyltransferase 1 n=1 Tax=Spongospora subterranea TaxID=70186 RepID=A0A0H5QJH6_9EUKA|eukprot:CRZ01466.1 hypothetical protein [Spongospora subterranea]
MKNRARRRPSDEVIGAGTSSKMDQPIAGDADYEPGSNELFAQIVDIFMKETRLDSVTHGLEGGRGAALVRDANGYIKEQIRRQRAKIFDKILKSRDAWQKKRSDPPFCRFIDKVSFTIGVACSLITSCLVGRSSLFMINWYTYLIMFLITLRLYLYRKEGYQYFLLDFCYFTTGLVFVYLYFYPNSQSLFVHIFAFANGPLAWAVPLWRNSLVFHDLDKLTSCAIHIFPMLLTFQLRWYPSNFSVCGPSWPVCEDIAISDIVVLPLLPYIIWQLAYTLKTQSKLFRLTKPVAIADDDLVIPFSRYSIRL